MKTSVENRPQHVYFEVFAPVNDRAQKCIGTDQCMSVWEKGHHSLVYYHIFDPVRDRVKKELQR